MENAATCVAPTTAARWNRPCTGIVRVRGPRRAVAVEGTAADVVARVAAATPAQLAAAGAALRRQRSDGWIWSIAMHEACWAVHLTGRERPALAAQLHAVRTLRHATGDARPAPDVVAAVVAAVHARVVADVLASHVSAAMTAPLDAAVG